MTWRPVAPPPPAVAAQLAASAGRHSRVRPFNTVAPSITGTVQAGNTVTAALGTWDGDATITYAQKWLLGGVDDVTTGTRAMVLGDVGKALRLLVTATNGVGSAQALSAAYTVLAANVYATWDAANKGASVTLSGGNLTASSNYSGSVKSTIGKAAGKHYFEVQRTGGGPMLLGIGNATARVTTAPAYPGWDANSWSLYWQDGDKYHSGAGVAYGGGAVGAVVVGVKLDLDNGTLGYIINGVDKGVAFSGLPAGTYYAMFGGGSSGAADTVTANFGASAFANAVPAGFNAGLYT